MLGYGSPRTLNPSPNKVPAPKSWSQALLLRKPNWWPQVWAFPSLHRRVSALLPPLQVRAGSWGAVPRLQASSLVANCPSSQVSIKCLRWQPALQPPPDRTDRKPPAPKASPYRNEACGNPPPAASCPCTSPGAPVAGNAHISFPGQLLSAANLDVPSLQSARVINTRIELCLKAAVLPIPFSCPVNTRQK